jgi:hypothetical protein
VLKLGAPYEHGRNSPTRNGGLRSRVRRRGSNASSNADALDRTDANCPEHVSAGHPKHRTVSDGFDTDRACLLIRGFRAPARKMSCLDGCGDLLDPSTAIRAAVLADSRVRSVELVGSRATGTATELSDWDYRITSSDPAAVAGRLPRLVAVLRPLGQLWDPLAGTPVYMIILPGAVKADLFPGARPGPGMTRAPWNSPHDTDAHFWDWNLWLGAKRLRGQDGLVVAELAKMWQQLLRPLGATKPPATQQDAVATYLRLRHDREQQGGDAVDHDLGAAVITRLRAAGLLPARPTADLRCPC